MAFEIRTRRRVEFAETDAAGIVHFSNFLRYMEEVEHAFLRSLGMSVHTAAVGFPRLGATFEYLSPARFEEILDIHFWVRRKGRTSLVYNAVFTRGGEEVARGEIATIACRVGNGGKLEPVSLPEEAAKGIEEAPYPPVEFRGRREGAGSGRT